MAEATVPTERRGAVLLARLDHAPVNALSLGLRTGLQAAIKEAAANPDIKALVITGNGRAFSAGADITEFAKGRVEPWLYEVIHQIEASTKPVIAAVNGLALGGGLEVALGCHYRVASTAAKQLGLPEVKIGIIPGAGGTQRLPRLIGMEAALDMIVSGAPIDAKKGHALGLIDKLTDGDVVAEAIAFAEDLIKQGKGPRRASEIKMDTSAIPADLFAKRRAAAMKHPSGPLAPAKCIEACEAAMTAPTFKVGMAKELACIQACMGGAQARALQYAFFAERQAANIADISADVKPRTIKSVGVIGVGTMGQGIGLAFLFSGFEVTFIETTKEALDRGISKVTETIAAQVKRGRMTFEQAQAVTNIMRSGTDLAALADMDLVIEAVFENMAVKKEVFGKLDAICKPGAILASNTSTLDVDEIARATKRPEDVIGLHFFSPANIMRLLEIVRGAKTSKNVLATAMAVSKKINKVGVVSGVCFGFIGNRMVESYMEEVQALLMEGATPEQVDSAYEKWGMAMGPLAVMDLAGMDVGWRIRKEHDIPAERRRLYAVTDSLVEAGRHGQKTKAGIYTYPDGRTRTVDTKVADMFRAEAVKQGINVRNGITAEEIVERGLLRLINTGADILAEGIAQRASDIDTIYLNGYGFQAWRGGPMWQADEMGLKVAAEKIKAYQAKYGARWTISPLIEKLAADGGTFAERDKSKA